MRVIIAGSRWPYNLDESYRELGRQHIRFALRDSGFSITELISGAAEGIDTLAARMALVDGIPVRQFPAQWRVNGQIDHLAGFKRNELMARNADAFDSDLGKWLTRNQRHDRPGAATCFGLICFDAVF